MYAVDFDFDPEQPIFISEECDEIPDQCFSENNCLTRITFPMSSVFTRIGNSAFSNCISFREIEIPATVEEIGEKCFYECNSLVRVAFARGSALKFIRQSAFAGCCLLREIEVPASVEEIGDNAFGAASDANGTGTSLCCSLSRVTFTNGSVLKRIGNRAFIGCSLLAEIEIPSSVEEIGDECFGVIFDTDDKMIACGSLRCVRFGKESRLKRIGRKAFMRCRSLQEVEIPAGVEELGESCFISCTLLSRVIFENGSVLKHIGKDAFAFCLNLGEIEIPGTVEHIGSGIFAQSSGLLSISFSCPNDIFMISDSLLIHKESKRVISVFGDAFEIEIPAWIENLDDISFCIPCSVVRFATDSVLKRIGDMVFSHNYYIHQITIPATVEEIGQACFRSASALSEITFARGSVLKRIGKRAFQACTMLQEIEIPASVEEIGDGCFRPEIDYRGRVYSCNSLSRVTFESGGVLKRIGRSAFTGCNKLKEIHIPASVEEIGDSCFGHICDGRTIIECNAFESITFEHGSRLKYIGNAAFSGCKYLREIEIPASVEEIGNDCFRVVVGIDRNNNIYRSCLSCVTFENGSVLKRIGSRAFQGCVKLQSIKIPASVEEICEDCFYQCESLSCVTFESGSVLKVIKVGAFEGCVQLQQIEIPATVEEIGDDCFSMMSARDQGENALQSCLSCVTFANGSLLKRIGSYVFRECIRLQKVEIPASVEEICEECFYKCESLSCVTFAAGSSLRVIRECAFSECVQLQEIEIPAAVEDIRTAAFCKCESLSCVTFVGGSVLKRIDLAAFRECVRLERIEIPATVEEIDNVGFYKCKSLVAVTFATGSVLKRIGKGAFAECRALEEIEIPASVEEIGGSCFRRKDYAKYLYKPSGIIKLASESVLKRIGKQAFMQSYPLQEIEIPATVEDISERCFCSCTNLLRVTFAPGCVVRHIRRRAFATCISLNEIEIPASVEEIGEECFIGCCSLSYVRFEEGSVLKRLRKATFQCCSSLGTISIPASVEEIGKRCFCGCSALSCVIFEKGCSLRYICERAFSDCCSLRRIHIPASVRQIGRKCFRFSLSLSRVTFAEESALEFISASAFSRCWSLKEIVRPACIKTVVDNATQRFRNRWLLKLPRLCIFDFFCAILLLIAFYLINRVPKVY